MSDSWLYLICPAVILAVAFWVAYCGVWKP
nr:MAG TPA: dystroglycan [Caudoviricetes sp.]